MKNNLILYIGILIFGIAAPFIFPAFKVQLSILCVLIILATTWNIQGGGYLVIKDGRTAILNLGGSGTWNRLNHGLPAPLVITADNDINVDSSGMSTTASYTLLIEVKKVTGYTQRPDYSNSV